MLSTNDAVRYPHRRNRAPFLDQLPGPGMTSYLVRAKAGKPIGPLAASLILRGIELRRVPFDAEVREEGTAEWVPLASVDEFYEAMGLDEAQTGQNERPLFDSVGESEGDEATRVLSSLWSDEPNGVARQSQAALAAGAELTPARAPSGSRLPPLPHPPPGAPEPRPGPLAVPQPPPGPPLAAATSPGSAGPSVAPGSPPSSSHPAPRLTPEASELMDADEDEDDAKMIRSIPGAEAPSNTGASFPIRPAAGDPTPSSIPPPARYLPDQADELTAPARRLIRQQEIIRRTLAYITAALVVALLVLVAVVLVR